MSVEDVRRLHARHFTAPVGSGVGRRVTGVENLSGRERYACGHCKVPWPCETIKTLDQYDSVEGEK